jgi:hypothetical protein
MGQNRNRPTRTVIGKVTHGKKMTLPETGISFALSPVTSAHSNQTNFSPGEGLNLTAYAFRRRAG